MRNILVFPDGSEHHFQYPKNRELEIGETLQAQLQDETIHVMTVVRVEKKEKEIFYHLELSQ